MIRAIAIRLLRQILLVVVGAEMFSCTEIPELSRRGHTAGRLSVDVEVDPPVDQTSVRSEQCPSLTLTCPPQAAGFRPTKISFPISRRRYCHCGRFNRRDSATISAEPAVGLVKR